MYLSHTLVLESFKRLRTNAVNGKRGKTPMERTSSLMIMLAADAVAKKLGVETLNLDFAKPDGKQTRLELGLQYSKFVTVSNSSDNACQSVYELGFVKIGGKNPEQRMSSNFMTTQLVDATKSETPYEYPHRPAPLLYLGKAATGMRYGIQLHPKWQDGIALHLADVASNTPFSDLAMFCMRFTDFPQKQTITETLCAMLHETFSKEVADFWMNKVSVEKMFAKHLRTDDFMEPKLVDSLATMNNTQSRRKELMKLDKEQLVELLIRLETSSFSIQ